MQMNRRAFLGSMVAAGAGPLLGVPASGRVARVGLVTDTHVGTTMESCVRVRAALELFKQKGVEMVVNCGDIADKHYPDGYRYYRKTVNEVYPDPKSRPIERFVYAFHEWRATRRRRSRTSIVSWRRRTRTPTRSSGREWRSSTSRSRRA